MTSPVHVGRALESLRNSDFDTVSAIGEVIDNALQAEAKNIRLKVSKREIRKGKHDLIELAFADDGIGMDIEILERCLQLGFSRRYNDRKGIGRFGVGMTLGAITQCTRIEVYSKPRGGGWNITYLDLNDMSEAEDPEIPPPKPVEIPREYADMMSDYGTLIIWKNLDREDASIDDIKRWIGRTYRKFIGQEIIEGSTVIPNPNQRHIFIDDGETNTEITAYDPLYATKTKYNQDEVAEIDMPVTIEEIVHEFDKPSKISPEPKVITIRMALLPEAWRKERRRSGGSEDNKNKRIPTNEGISILRNGREVFYGSIPYYKIRDPRSGHKGFLDLDRFWGCEIEFDAELDHWFSIKNIKVGARPLPELREKIENAINPTIQDYRAEIRKIWDETEKENAVKNKELDGTEDAEGAIRKTLPQKVKPTEEDIDELIKKSGEIREEIKKEIKLKLANSPIAFIKDTKMDRRGNFIDIISRGGSIIINLNMQHSFFKKFFKLAKTLSTAENDKNQQEKIIEDMQTNLLLLIASFTLARKSIIAESQDSEDPIDKLLHTWGYNLDKTVQSTLEDSE